MTPKGLSFCGPAASHQGAKSSLALLEGEDYFESDFPGQMFGGNVWQWGCTLSFLSSTGTTLHKKSMGSQSPKRAMHGNPIVLKMSSLLHDMEF